MRQQCRPLRHRATILNVVLCITHTDFSLIVCQVTEYVVGVRRADAHFGVRSQLLRHLVQLGHQLNRQQQQQHQQCEG